MPYLSLPLPASHHHLRSPPAGDCRPPPSSPPKNFSGERFRRTQKCSPSPDLSDPIHHTSPRAAPASITPTQPSPLHHLSTTLAATLPFVPTTVTTNTTAITTTAAPTTTVTAISQPPSPSPHNHHTITTAIPLPPPPDHPQRCVWYISTKKGVFSFYKTAPMVHLAFKFV
uniref:Uncharacterized protein n=1 Tax=Tanacetum cinerariifolium TaxID=118510 RepID=A0A699IBF5_TANCI|nr:hypothetical protein [Tanacetum cinerariifolium]